MKQLIDDLILVISLCVIRFCLGGGLDRCSPRSSS
jgi:hypothetical protein